MCKIYYQKYLKIFEGFKKKVANIFYVCKYNKNILECNKNCYNKNIC